MNQILERNVPETDTDVVRNDEVEGQDSEYTNVKRQLIERRRKDRDGRMIAKEKAKLNRFKDNPESMIGKVIKHLCKWEDDTEWFTAKVRDMVELKADPLNIKYNIIYDDYVREVWTFPLLRDFKNGDMIVCE